MSSESYSSVTQTSQGSEMSEYAESSTNDIDDGEPPRLCPSDSNVHLRVGEDQLQSIGLCMALTKAPSDDVPTSWRQAINIPHWRSERKLLTSVM